MSRISGADADAATSALAAAAQSQVQAGEQNRAAGPVTAKATATDQELSAAEVEEEFDEEAYRRGRFVLFNALPSSVVSGVIHFVGFLILALTTMQPPPASETLAINAGSGQQPDKVEELQEENLALRVDESQQQSQATQQVLQDAMVATDSPMVTIDVEVAPIRVELSDFSERTAPKNDLMATLGSIAGSGLDSRGANERGNMVQAIGGTPESEAAVALALKWFAEHQNADGSWSFDHRLGPCRGKCSDPGSLSDCRTGATAMALLPFLGAGQTHLQGQYKEVVERGLYYLTGHMRVRNEGGMQAGDLAQSGGNMYSHGLAAITLCEAYAMTHDRKLMLPAQLSLNHIMFTQDPVGGGWRYFSRQPGDTSVVGWQLMALKSGHMAYLSVDPKTIQGASRFLDSVQADSGAKYGYTTPGQGWGTTSVGLLCRMYLGWKQDNLALQRGVKLLADNGPMTVPLANMYYNYYATQVLRHYCGDPGTEGHEMWEKWNAKMRDFLISSQDKSGHQRGSWIMRGDHGSDKGGRLYCTSMAAMILEVYYRHMPIYGKQAATEEFPL